MVNEMKVRFVVSTMALGALIFAGCSGGGGGGGSGSSTTYDSGAGGAAAYGASTGSGGSSSDSASLTSEVHSVIHEEKQDERIHKAAKTEALLGPSGFKSMPIDNPAKQKVISGLVPLSFNRLGHHGKIHYWFADPYYCNCVFVGNELAYLRYKQAKSERKQEKEETYYLIDQENQVAEPIDSEWDPVSTFGEP
jgi:hypothetical protein